MPPKTHTTPSGGSGDGPGTSKGDGSGDGGTPPKKVGDVDAGKSVSSAQTAVQRLIDGGTPGQATGATTPSHIPTTPNTPTTPSTTTPTTPPNASDIHLPPGAKEHILDGDGGRQGGHYPGTGFSKKTEFPKGWDADKIQDAAYQVTQSGNPVKGPFPTKDADGNVRMAYNYEGKVDGITVRTTVFADNGEIRTAFPPNGGEKDGSGNPVIENPPAPNPAPKGVPMSEPPRYNNPEAGGDGSWVWQGPKGNEIIRVIQHPDGTVERTVLGPYSKK
ncbi:EndoU domain-containing protein [Actinophytocola sp. NPDC049390]|uniref:EndoU domain-containing protein n=1 Tax=Actinophytocola sp. NPDC049390 TaxID=3363894 RepID=UPI00378D0B01